MLADLMSEIREEIGNEPKLSTFGQHNKLMGGDPNILEQPIEYAFQNLPHAKLNNMELDSSNPPIFEPPAKNYPYININHSPTKNMADAYQKSNDSR